MFETSYICHLIKKDLVAQLVEQYTFNVWVLGSNPSQVTFLFDFFLFLLTHLSARGGIGRRVRLRA